MKLIKMLGLSMVAAAVAMALIGATSASATVLCKSAPNASNECTGETYPAETAISGSSSNAKLVGPFGLAITCSSAVSGEVTSVGGEQVTGTISSASFTSCNANCEVEVLQLPWKAHVNQNEAAPGNGFMYIHEGSAGSGQPGARIFNCSTFPQTIANNCTFKGKETQPGYSEEVVKMTVNGGNSPTIVANAKLKSSCFEGTWTATYAATPAPMWVAHK